MAGSKCCASWCVARSSSSNHILSCVHFWASKFGTVTKVRGGKGKIRLILDAKASGFFAAPSKCVRHSAPTSGHCEDVARFNFELGDPAGQQAWESLAALVAVRLW